MPLTAYQHSQRRRSIGASEAAAALGENPWASPYDVWASKVYDYSTVETPRTATGNYLEAGVAKEFADRKSLKLKRGRRRVHPAHKCVTATLDYVTDEDEPANVEIKTVGPWAELHWGEDGAGPAGVPPWYRIQVQQQMACSGLRRTYVAAKVLHSCELRVYEVPFDEPLATAIVMGVAQFWERYVVPKEPPPIDGSDACAAHLARQYPEVSKPVWLDGGAAATNLVLAYHKVCAELEACEQAKATIRNELCALIGEHEGVKTEAGLATWRAKRGGIDYKTMAGQLAADAGLDGDDWLAELERYRRPSFRELRVTRAK
jgi:putative phage-type endonuclease